ncbi:MAG: chemotaxis protein CheW [Mycobacteriales bacterium]
MTVTQFSTFSLDGQLYGIQVESVHSVTRFQALTHVPLAAPSVAGLLNLRGQVTTAIDMRVRLDLPPRDADAIPMNVVVKTDDGLVSLLVDSIGDVENTTPDQFDDVPESMTGAARELVIGAYTLPNSQLLLALDVARTVDVGIRSAAPAEVMTDSATK